MSHLDLLQLAIESHDTVAGLSTPPDPFWKVFVVVFFAALVVIIVVLICLGYSVIKKNEKRTDTALAQGRSVSNRGIMLDVGASPQPTATSEPSKTQTTESPQTNGGQAPSLKFEFLFQLIKAAEVALERPETSAIGYQGLLQLLWENSKHALGKKRRASIALLRGTGDNRVLDVVAGYPQPDVTLHKFYWLEYAQTRKGLSWKVVEDALIRVKAPDFPEIGKPLVEMISDAPSHPNFLPLPGHKKFGSIMIAPIVSGREILGVVCLDAEDRDFYEPNWDQNLIASFAWTLAVVLKAKQLTTQTTIGELPVGTPNSVD